MASCTTSIRMHTAQSISMQIEDSQPAKKQHKRSCRQHIADEGGRQQLTANSNAPRIKSPLYLAVWISGKCI
jgi:hypothetical protein